MFNLLSVVNTFAFDPRNPRVIYAGNQAPGRSVDLGRTWSMIFADPRKNMAGGTGPRRAGGHSEPRSRGPVEAT